MQKSSIADDFNQIVEILVQDQNPYKTQQNPFPTPVKQPSKKGLLGNVLHFKSKDKEPLNINQNEMQG